ncbi:putative GTP-binding protein EngB [Balamuthia mandrillaris]
MRSGAEQFWWWRCGGRARQVVPFLLQQTTAPLRGRCSSNRFAPTALFMCTTTERQLQRTFLSSSVSAPPLPPPSSAPSSPPPPPFSLHKKKKRKASRLLGFVNHLNHLNQEVTTSQQQTDSSSSTKRQFKVFRLEGDDDMRLLRKANDALTREARFVLATGKEEQFPATNIPEVAFAGRSNVGKSSLLNAVMQKPGLAKTSSTPGRTQTINFFEAGEGAIRLVDLPGYGYADAPVATVVHWVRFIETYLLTRGTLKRVCVLLDARRGVLRFDKQLMQLLNANAIPFQVLFYFFSPLFFSFSALVLLFFRFRYLFTSSLCFAHFSFKLIITKTDKVKSTDLANLIQKLQRRLDQFPFCSPFLHVTSVKERIGVDELRLSLFTAAELHKK